MKLSVRLIEDKRKTALEKILFTLSWLILFASIILEPQGRSGVKFFGRPVPSFCLFYNLTGYPDLGCGLTRSFVNMAHFHLRDAFYSHFLGPFIFLGFLAVTLYLTYRIFGGKKKLKTSTSTSTALIIAIVAVLIVIVIWIVKLSLHLDGQEKLLKF